MKCKVLVAEDELIERKVLCKTLQKYLGDLILLYEARNGREAIALFEREAPQVAILDIEMPGATSGKSWRGRRRPTISAQPSSVPRCRRSLSGTIRRTSPCRMPPRPCATRMPISASCSNSASR